MSLRKAKKLLEQKKAIQANIKQDSAQQEEQELQLIQKPAGNMFSAFEVQDSDKEQEPITKQEKSATKQEKKNKDGEQQAKKKKKKNKKKKNTNNQLLPNNKQQQEEEDVEKIFKQVGMQYNKNQNNQDIPRNFKEQDWETILRINESKFNYERQLRRHFNNHDNFNEEDKNDSEMSKKQQKYKKHLKKMMKKSVLSPGVQDYFPIGEKFEIDRDEDKVRFMPTKKYSHYQVEYQAIRNSNDINALFGFSQMHPEHVDSLYFVGEFLRLQGNYRDADNLIQKVIYVYQAAGGYDLMEFIKADLVKKQIVYDAYSTSLFMALFKFMDILGKKGCFKAALQYNKFLLKININDPTACLLCMDYNSISSKNYNYLLNFVKNYSQYCGQTGSTLYLLPNFIYSTALAKFYLENQKNTKQQLVVEQTNLPQLISFTQEHWEKALHLPFKEKYPLFDTQCSQVLLLRAILVYPNIIYQISQKNQYSKQFMNHSTFVKNQQKTFKQIFTHQFWEIIPSSYSYYFLKLENVKDSAGLDKVLEVYLQRSKILWKSKEIMLLVKGAVGFVLNQIDEGKFNYQQFLENLCLQQQENVPNIPFNLGRYEKIVRANFSDRVQQVDLANIQDNQQQAPVNQNRMGLEGNPISLFLNSLLPWVNLPASQHHEEQYDPDMPDIHDD